VKIVAFADTHGLHEKVNVPDGDVLIFAGDLCNSGRMRDVERFAEWFNPLPHKHKVVVAGNHDIALQNDLAKSLTFLKGAHYLEDDSVEISGIKIYGSPWTPKFQSWAFMKKRGEDIKAKWDLIPDGLDILVTHGPPEGTLDNNGHDHIGCRDLKDAVGRAKPRLHIFGHCHEDQGSAVRFRTEFMNVSICDGEYDPCRKPMVFEI